MKKIVILGPESTGKSTLCEQLAAHFKSRWVPEYARTYLEGTGNVYAYEDLWEIAKGQMEAEEAASGEMISGEMASGKWKQGSSSASASYSPLPTPHFPLPANESLPLFIDTDFYVIKIWSEISFNKCDNRILTQIAQKRYDLYLLCNTDLPWTEDPLREYPDLAMRKKIYAFYKDAMVNQPVPWVDISGNYEERLNKAIHAVNGIL